MLEGPRQTLLPATFDKPIQQLCVTHSVVNLCTARSIQLNELLADETQCSVTVSNVNVYAAEIDARTTIGVRLAELRAPARDTADAKRLQYFNQWVFESLTPHKRLDIARNHYVNEHLRIQPWSSLTRKLVRTSKELAQEVKHVV